MKISKNKTITVLGGSGYIGSQVVRIFIEKGYRVKILDMKNINLKSKNLNFTQGSILDKKKLSKVIQNSKYVFNFAALANIDKATEKAYETASINILGTINILEICKKFRIEKIIHASSVYANSEQGGFYGCSKKASEDYIERFQQRYNLKYTILRFGSLYGGKATNDNGLQKLISFAKKNKKISYSGTKNASRKYIHIHDAASACYETIKKKYDNKYLIVTGNHIIKIVDVIRTIQKALNIKNKNIKFLNIENNVHYEKQPKKYVPREGKNLIINTSNDFKKNLINLIKVKK